MTNLVKTLRPKKMKLAFLTLAAAVQLANCWPVQVADLSFIISDVLLVLSELLQNNVGLDHLVFRFSMVW